MVKICSDCGEDQKWSSFGGGGGGIIIGKKFLVSVPVFLTNPQTNQNVELSQKPISFCSKISLGKRKTFLPVTINHFGISISFCRLDKIEF